MSGEGTCVAVDCVGAWSTCDSHCRDRRYTVQVRPGPLISDRVIN